MVNTVHEMNVFALRHLVVAVIKQLTLLFQSKELCSWSQQHSKTHSNCQFKINAHV